MMRAAFAFATRLLSGEACCAILGFPSHPFNIKLVTRNA